MFATIAVDQPDRAAAALAELISGHAARFAPQGDAVVLAGAMRIGLAAAGERPRRGVTVLPLTTGYSVEQVIDAACRHGFHAEETRHGVLEFWIDEHTAIELATPEAKFLVPLLLAA